ncbi:RNA 3'-terminal phosphate cyclase-like [Antedon mediterranea]|uniref:RNA 3'-terminal phosphate cyclase-like n=1 Tax=Antedon mediterranea TaxID=105859 RepID=UPI003AF4BEFB
MAAVVIDGAFLEGGGQILRMSTALSCLTKQPITINNIRANRSKPGLRPQHLSGIKLVANLCKGKLRGDEVGSSCVSFSPGHTSKGTYEADTKTAGSICLLLQVSLPVMLFADGSIQATFKGGTNAEFAPQIDYSLLVFQPIAKRFGINFEADIIRRGYYPKGGGSIAVVCEPIKCIKPLNLTDPGHLVRISGRAFVAGVLPARIADTMSKTATSILKKRFPNIPVKIDVVHETEQDALGNGTGIIIVAETSTGCLLGGSGLGKRGVQAEKVASDAAESLIAEIQHGGCVDEYLQDQLIIFMALAEGQSRLLCGPISLHTQTAIHIAEQLTKAKFTVTPAAGKEACFMIECQGIGLQNTALQS